MLKASKSFNEKNIETILTFSDKRLLDIIETFPVAYAENFEMIDALCSVLADSENEKIKVALVSSPDMHL